MAVPDVTRQLAERVLAVRFDTLPTEVVAAARGVVLDGVATMLAGAREPVSGIVVRHLARYGGVGQATVVGHDRTLAPLDAAYANATAAHALDFELMWYPPTHPTSPVLPAILALAETRPVSGQQLIEALVAGFEVQGRLHLAAFASVDRWLRGLHFPGLVGPFGSAAACARLLALDVHRLQMAFGIAGSRVAGLMANTGTMAKSSHPAGAARGGLESALLAAEGYTAAPDILGAGWGYNDVFYDGELDLSVVIDRFGDPYRMVDPGVIVKKHPAQYPTHWSIDAALEVRADPAYRAAAVRRVRIEVGADNEAARVHRPATGLGGKFSIAYTVAVALLDGEVTIDSFSDERLAGADVQDLLGCIEVVRRPEVTAMDFATAWSRVTVEQADGSEVTARVDRPAGIWDHPIAWDRWVAKFRTCAMRSVADARATEILARIEALDQLEDVTELTQLLRTEGPGR